MSATETSGQDPKPNRHQPYPAGKSVAEDPLLSSGTFIDPTFASVPHSSVGVRKFHTTNTTDRPTAQSRGSSISAPEFRASQSSNGAEQGTPSVRPRRKGAEQDTSWLPRGWIVEDKVRTSGATAGSVDRYYYDPVSHRRFRSKKEVLYFLETGSVFKRRKMENPDAEPGGSEGQKQKSNTKEKVSVVNFDFIKVPEKVKWVLTDYSDDSWMPCIGNEKLPEFTKLEWEAAYESLTSKFTFLSSENGGRNN